MRLHLEATGMSGPRPLGALPIEVTIKLDLTPATAALVDAIGAVLRSLSAEIAAAAVAGALAAALPTPPVPEAEPPPPAPTPLPAGEGLGFVGTVEPPPAAQPASAQPAARPPPGRPGTRSPNPSPAWSEARLAVLAQDYPKGVLSADIEVRINALPGPVLTRKVIGQKAFLLGYRRPSAPAPVARAPAPPTAPEPPAAEAQNIADDPPAPPAPPRFVSPRLVDDIARVHQTLSTDDEPDPVMATATEILAWARTEGGFDKREGAPLPAVNARRAELELPPFRLQRAISAFDDVEERHARTA